MKLPAVAPRDRFFGFRGSVQRAGSQLIHAISRRNHHLTVCGFDIATRMDRVAMNVNGEMEVVTCLRCWMTPDPNP